MITFEVDDDALISFQMSGDEIIWFRITDHKVVSTYNPRKLNAEPIYYSDPVIPTLFKMFKRNQDIFTRGFIKLHDHLASPLEKLAILSEAQE